jgi:hypothetical protein
MMILGISGGLIAAMFAFPYGYAESILAYTFAGALFSLIPGAAGVYVSPRH